MHPPTRIQEGFKFGGVVLPKIKISVFGAKMLSSPETPGISPDTPGFLNTPGETPGIGPETPDLGVRILREGARILRKMLSRILQIFGLESERW